MKKILMTAVVVLVAGTPLAFAASSGNSVEADSRHCTYVGQKSDLCRQDTHKNGGEEASGFGQRG
jgi:hypothetical protein